MDLKKFSHSDTVAIRFDEGDPVGMFKEVGEGLAIEMPHALAETLLRKLTELLVKH